MMKLINFLGLFYAFGLMSTSACSERDHDQPIRAMLSRIKPLELLEPLDFDDSLGVAFPIKSEPASSRTIANEALQGDLVPTYQVIPAGQFDALLKLSSSSYREERWQKIEISRSFLLQRTEVTQGQWEAVMGTSPQAAKNCGVDCPIESVTWFDAALFTNALSRLEGLPECYEIKNCERGTQQQCSPYDHPRQAEEAGCQLLSSKGPDCAGYRLPTYMEWRYALFAGKPYFYDSLEDLYDKLAVESFFRQPYRYATSDFSDECLELARGRFREDGLKKGADCFPGPVQSKKATPWGLFDMLGNVQEFIEDSEQPNLQEDEKTVLLLDPVFQSPTEKSSLFQAVGGQLSRSMMYIIGSSPAIFRSTDCNSLTGFRVARTLFEKQAPSNNDEL